MYKVLKNGRIIGLGRKEKIIIGLIVAILLFGIVYGVYSYYRISNPKNLFEKPPNMGTLPDSSRGNSIREEEDPLLKDPFHFSHRVNFLFLGLDADTRRYETMGSFRTDTIMLVSIDFDNQDVDIISIPRDSYVEIAGLGRKEKINAAFTRGGGLKGKGFEKSVETISKFLGGIPIHHYIGIDMNVVKDVVDIMDGVNYDVDIQVKVGGRVLEKGYQRLNGQQVLDYARTRQTSGGDIDRVDRQQRLVIAIFEQLKSSKQLLKLPQYYTAIIDNVHTNLDIKQVAGLALFSTKIDLNDIDRHMIPGGYLNMDKISYWGINEYKKRDLIKDIFDVDIDVDKENDISYIRKELEAQEEAFKKAVEYSQTLIANFNDLVEKYEEQCLIKEDEINNINALMPEINEITESGDIEALEEINKSLKRHIEELETNIEKRQTIISEAQGIVATISNRFYKYQKNGLIQSDDKDARVLSQKMVTVNRAVESRDMESIKEAVADLETYSEKLFEDCRQRQEKKDREKAIDNAQTIIKSVEQDIQLYIGKLTNDEKDKLNGKIIETNNAIKSGEIKNIEKTSENLRVYAESVFAPYKNDDKIGEEDEDDSEDDDKSGENREDGGEGGGNKGD